MKPIQVFLRTCFYSPNQDLPNRTRPTWFSKVKCFRNFGETINNDLADYTFIHDNKFGPPADYILKDSKGFLDTITCGTEAESFLKTMDYVLSCNNLSDDTIIYFLEDDYLHKPGWCKALIEGFKLGADYLSLHDHADKYRDYPDLKSKILLSETTHWRTTPSTCNTFACKLKTLRQDAEIHRKYSENLKITQDWAKFEDLQSRGRVLLSSIPGLSTHCVPRDLSPITDWEILQSQTTNAIYYGD